MKKNGRKEEILNLYCKLNPNKLNDVLKTNLKENDMILERKFEDRRVDIAGINNGTRYYIEVLIKKTDEEHYRQIEKLIKIASCEEKSVIVWIATEFNQHHIQQLFKLVAVNYNKKLQLKIVKLNKKVIALLEEIDKINILEQMESFYLLDSLENLFVVTDEITCCPNKETISAKVIDGQIYYTKKQKILIDVAKTLRIDFPTNPNVHKFKSVINGNYISIGSAITGDIEYRVVYNRGNNMGIELYFGNNKKKIFHQILEESDSISEMLDYVPLVWNIKHEKIGWYIGSTYNYDEEQIVKRLARMTKRYICVFDKYIRKYIVNINELNT